MAGTLIWGVQTVQDANLCLPPIRRLIAGLAAQDACQAKIVGMDRSKKTPAFQEPEKYVAKEPFRGVAARIGKVRFRAGREGREVKRLRPAVTAKGEERHGRLGAELVRCLLPSVCQVRPRFSARSRVRRSKHRHDCKHQTTEHARRIQQLHLWASHMLGRGIGSDVVSRFLVTKHRSGCRKGQRSLASERGISLRGRNSQHQRLIPVPAWRMQGDLRGYAGPSPAS